MERASGILMHISSLYGDYSSGSFGKEAFEFVDFLAQSGFTYWQVLPFCITDEVNSPYKSYGTFCGNPFFVDLETLYKKNLITKEELDSAKQNSPYLVEHSRLKEERFNLLYKASTRVKDKKEILSFINSNKEIADFCEFMAYKNANNGKPFYEWNSSVEIDNDILFCWQFIEYEFFNEWKKVKEYANNKGVKIIGDMPMYSDLDSCEVWKNPTNYLLDKNGRCKLVAGVPPDYFSKDGQLWGNPIYNYKEMKKDNFSWWKRRISFYGEIFDGVRIDHFRAFESYFGIKRGEKTAKNGKWYKGGRKPLIDAIKSVKNDTLIIAEDLGVITNEVRKLVEYSGFSGMKVLQFAFLGDNNSPHLPHNYQKNCVAYTGTHDNNTLLGYVWELDEDTRKRVFDYFNYYGTNWSEACEVILKSMLASHSDLVIFPIQDVLGFGSDTRINTPGSSENNWGFRITKEQLNSIDRSKWLRYNTLFARK